MIPRKQLENFRQLYKARFGVELDDVEAERIAREVITLYISILGGMPLLEDKNKENERIIT